MSPPGIEIRWQVGKRDTDRLAVGVSLRREPTFEDEPLVERTFAYPELLDRFGEHQEVLELLKTWLMKPPERWTAAGPDRNLDPGHGWANPRFLTLWGGLLGGILVDAVVGSLLDRLVVESTAEATDPRVRLLFALRGPMARRLPVETLIWPRALFGGPVAAQRGISLLREAEPTLDPARLVCHRRHRVVLTGATTKGHADEQEWRRLMGVVGAQPDGPANGRASGPSAVVALLEATPEIVLRNLSQLHSDLAIVWGHGVRQVDRGSPVWEAAHGEASGAEIRGAICASHGAAITAMCFSGTEGVRGGRSIVSGLAAGGVPFVVGFQGEPSSASVTQLVGDFVSQLRAEEEVPGCDPAPGHLVALERALHYVRTQGGDVHAVQRQVVAEVVPWLTLGRTQRPLPPAAPAGSSASVVMQAYRTAGQLVITELADGRRVRVPVPVDPLEFEMWIDDRALRLDYQVPGLEPRLMRILSGWKELAYLELDCADAPVPGRPWGLMSAMLEAIVEGCERLAGVRRPRAVEAELARARARDWGSPPALSVVEVQTGAVVACLGRVWRDLRVRALGATSTLSPGDLKDLRDHPPLQGFDSTDWAAVDRAAAGDMDALAGLVAAQRRAFRSLTGVPDLQNLPPLGLAIPAKSEWIRRMIDQG